VSWDDCQEFCRRLSRKVGRQIRLPTEAEWEYACRAGTMGTRYEADLGAIAWYSRNSGNATHPVGQKKPNPWGLYDMLGNVREWCSDGPRDYAKGRAVVMNPTGPVTEPLRVLRGGSWITQATLVRAATRLWCDPGLRHNSLGFRLARCHGEGDQGQGPSSSTMPRP